METPNLESALQQEVARVTAEEQATASRAEKAGDAAAAPKPDDSEARKALATLAALPPEVVTPILVAALDVLMVRVADEKWRLSSDERQLMIEVWTPAVRHYMPSISVHPLTLAIAGTGLVYGMKTLPPGALGNLLGGGAQGVEGAASTSAGAQGASGAHNPAGSGSSPEPATAAEVRA